MDSTEIQKHVSELEALVTEEGAKLFIYVDEEEEGTCEVIGNRKGYLRAGIDLLRASSAPLEPNDFITPVDLNYLRVERSLIVKRLIRREDVEAALPPVKGSSWQEKAMGTGCVAMLVFFVVCAFWGFGDLISLFFRK